MYADPCGLGFWDFALLPHKSSDYYILSYMGVYKLVPRCQINIVSGQLSRFEPELKNEDSQNCRKIKKLWNLQILMFDMMESTFYCTKMKQK